MSILKSVVNWLDKPDSRPDPCNDNSEQIDVDGIIGSGTLISDEVFDKRCPYGQHEPVTHRLRVYQYGGEKFLIEHVSPSRLELMYSYGPGAASGSTREPIGTDKRPTQLLGARRLTDD